MAIAPQEESRVAQSLWLGGAVLLVLIERLYLLGTAALPDYDSFRNWQILQEIAHGNLRNLFHHGAPGFSVLYAPLAWWTTDFRVFQHLNAVVAVAALVWLVVFLGRRAALSAYQVALLLLFTGSSVFLTFSGRDFTMNAWSLLLFSALLQAYYRWLNAPTTTNLLRATGCLALGLTINYKFLLCVPILALLELLFGKGEVWKQGRWWRALLILLLPYVVFGAVGVAAGLPWHRWLAVYYKIPFPGADNLAGRSGQPHFYADLLYYPRFLLDFESPLVLASLVAAPLVFGRQWLRKQGKGPDITAYLAIWVYCFLVGMSLVQKAPRGLLLAYGPLYGLCFLTLCHLLPRRWVAVVMGAGILFNLYRVQREVYAYTPSNYPKVAAWLRSHQAEKVGSTVGMSVAPFLQHPDSVAWVTDEHQLTALRRRGYRYALLDSYWRVAGVQRFDSLRQQKPVAAWPEPWLTSPLLFLEHSEFTGQGYPQTLARQRQATQDSVQLRLYQLP